jgi:hypothetical protein
MLARSPNRKRAIEYLPACGATAIPFKDLPLQLSVFLPHYGQSSIKGAAFNEQISPSARIASYRKSDC